MIDFMVLGLPRSGTAWMANFLTTNDSVCLHESFMDYDLDQLNKLDLGCKLGISETAGIFHIDAINAIDCKKLIIERPLDEINNSLVNLRFPTMRIEHVEMLSKLEGHRVKFTELFTEKTMKFVCKEIAQIEFNIHRFHQLCKMHVENIDAINRVRSMI